MKKWGRKQWIRLAGVTVAVIGVLLVLPAFEVCTDYAYVCENTGSRKGHREWFFGLHTGAWDYQSPLDTFMQQTHPDQLEHRWMSYAGTGKNILGQSMSWGHGKSPLSQLRFARDLEAYLAILPPERRWNSTASSQPAIARPFKPRSMRSSKGAWRLRWTANK